MFHLKLLTIFSIIFFNAILAESVTSDDCDIPCDTNEERPVCVLDKDEVCFTKFSTECIMERMACIFGKNYEIYFDAFCELENFLCSDIIQSPQATENESHSYNEDSKESIEVVFQDKNDNQDLSMNTI